MNIGDIIKEYRVKYNITMDDFAQMSGLSKGYISRHFSQYRRL